jgi:hypothetical protein
MIRDLDRDPCGLRAPRAGGFILTREEPAEKWGAATYALVRTT